MELQQVREKMARNHWQLTQAETSIKKVIDVWGQMTFTKFIESFHSPILVASETQMKLQRILWNLKLAASHHHTLPHQITRKNREKDSTWKVKHLY